MKSSSRASPFTSGALFTIVGGAVLINPAFAQQPQEQENQQAGEEIPTIVVTGMRGSLNASMVNKRDAIGVVDSINAEDIGKFPDTNLSESLQRITGVSIDRRNGEGATVTARGFGPEFNMVTLNGRQMPAADAFANGAATGGGQFGNTRSFNFANLAAESISAVEVYKTGRADIATGGIGASINVRTARPLDTDGMVLNIGAKALNDSTNRVGDDFTPEVSGIFCYATENRTFGVGLSASYQKRDSGSSGSTVNDWHIHPWNTDLAANRSITPLFVDTNDTPYFAGDDEVAATIENAPAQGQLYGIPNDIRYVFSDIERERVNGQLTVQFAPVEGLTLTADYTFAQSEIVEDRGEQTIWLQRNGFDHIVFDTNEAVATPVLMHEFTGAAKDFGYEQQHREQKNDLRSVGLQPGLGGQRPADARLRLPQLQGAQPAERSGHRRRRDRLQPGGQGAGHLPRGVRTESRRSGGQYSLPQCLELLDSDLPVQQRPAGRVAHAVSGPVRRICRNRRRGQLRVLGRPASARRCCASRTTTRPPTSSRHASTESSRSSDDSQAGLRFRDPCDGFAPARLGRLHGIRRLGRGRRRHRARHGGVVDAVQPHGRFRRLQPGRRAHRRMERQCEYAGPMGHRQRPVSQQLDRELGARWPAALQPGLQHGQHRGRGHAARCMHNWH